MYMCQDPKRFLYLCDYCAVLIQKKWSTSATEDGGLGDH